MSRLNLSSKSLPGVKEDMDILDEHGNGVRLEVTSIRSFFESFIKIWHQERCQDLTCQLSLFLESRRTSTFLMNLEMVSDWREHPSEASVKVSSRSILLWLIYSFSKVCGGWVVVVVGGNLSLVSISIKSRLDLIWLDLIESLTTINLLQQAII